MMHPHTHCPKCRKPLSVAEMIEQYCETCNAPVNKSKQDKRAT